MEASRLLIAGGLLLVAVGVYVRLGLPVPPLGRLPGDLVIQRGGMTLYIPITTMVVVSLVLTLLVSLLARSR